MSNRTKPSHHPLGPPRLTLEELELLYRLPHPPPLDRNPPTSTPEGFPPQVVKAIDGREVRAFYGIRIDPEAVAEAAARSTRLTGILNKLDRARDLTLRVAAEANATLLATATTLVRDQEEFAARFPDAADALQPLWDWYESLHPGRPSAPRSQASNDTPASAGQANPERKPA